MAASACLAVGTGGLLAALGAIAGPPGTHTLCWALVPVGVVAIVAAMRKRDEWTPRKIAAVALATLAVHAALCAAAVWLLTSIVPPGPVAVVLAGLAIGAAAGNVIANLWWRKPLTALPDPRRGEVWWADIEFEESRHSKDRPCLVIGGNGRRRTVLMFTSQNKTGRAGYLPTPRGLWRNPPASSFLKTDRVISARVERFRRFEAEAGDDFLAAAEGRSGSGRAPAR